MLLCCSWRAKSKQAAPSSARPALGQEKAVGGTRSITLEVVRFLIKGTFFRSIGGASVHHDGDRRQLRSLWEALATPFQRSFCPSLR